MTDSAEFAHVIGSGANGLAAAIVLARKGRKVHVYEAQSQPGGGARTMELTLPGFRHDFGSAIHAMAASSPFFNLLPLERHGVHWVHGQVPLAHPLDDGTAVVLERDLSDAERALEQDGRAWRRLLEPLVEQWPAFARDAMGPVMRVPLRPLLMARFGCVAFQPALRLAKSLFSSARTRALWGGLAAHSFLSLDAPLSSAIGLVMAAVSHVAGWPVARGGSQAITDALIACLAELGGEVHLGRRIDSLDELDPQNSLVLCDVTPRQLLAIAGNRLSRGYRESLQRFRYGPGAFKIDFALSEPIPWRAAECRRVMGLHIGGSIEEIARSEYAVAHGSIAERPFMIVAQPTLFDPSRAPEGKHVAWVYCHVPNGCAVDMTSRIEDQIERFAPGFRDCVMERHVSSPATLESMNANLVGGDVSGGEMSLTQFFLRPALGIYYTGTPNLYICSSSTPPGGGVHGMCGYHAARMALRRAAV